MEIVKWFPWLAAAMIFARWLAEAWPEELNRRSVLAHAATIPEAYQGSIDEMTYAKSVQYTLARGRFSQVEDTYGTAVLVLILFSGLLPWGLNITSAGFGPSAWSMAAFLFIAGFALSLPEPADGLVSNSSGSRNASASIPPRRNSGGWIG